MDFLPTFPRPLPVSPRSTGTFGACSERTAVRPEKAQPRQRGPMSTFRTLESKVQADPGIRRENAARRISFIEIQVEISGCAGKNTRPGATVTHHF